MDFQKAINDTPIGGKLTIPADAVLDSSLTIQILKDISIEGNGCWHNLTTDGTELGRAGRTRSNIRIMAKNVSISNLNVRGANKKGPVYNEALEAQHGFEIVGGSNVTLTNCSAKDVNGDGLYIGMGPVDGKTGLGVPSTVVTVNTFSATNCARMGVTWVSGEDVYITQLKIDGTGRSAIDIEPNATARVPGEDPNGKRFRIVRRGLFDGIDARNYNFNLVAAGGVGTVEHVTFRNVTCDEWRVWVGERSVPGVNVPLRGPFLFDNVRAETASDGGSQDPKYLQGAQCMLFNMRNVTLHNVQTGMANGIKSVAKNSTADGRISNMVRAVENTVDTTVIASDATYSTGIAHKDSLPVVVIRCTNRGVAVDNTPVMTKSVILPELPQQAR